MKEQRMKKLGTWNLVALVLTSIGAVFSVVSLPGTLFPNKEALVSVGGEALYNQVNSWTHKVPAVLEVVISLVFAALFFMAYKQIKSGKLPNKLIYFLNIGYFVLSLILDQVVLHSASTDALAGLDSQTAGVASTAMAIGSIVGILFAVLLHLPQIMCLIHLFKLEDPTVDNE
ncbi:hypothetical protein [Enterococcus columbae]|uniref:Uncharacterized protein n=1 Tax=Enterococcus columbae DSM 7374 = ATCC 51263 TaxID=1121865 RepID=S1NQ01_9ENTE|nr:hypothetical protein [Enterococcus columbae]EOT38551.1 hypothetical protein OMW_02191 [Enterococcus columbae DSM 7374 = ATCC 51263]EOW87798.1 hypothetical protein I568_00084 [Enterococcus columbae DSM 7374 = ATCC 51263]OJG22666.1 hypothetical protein RR47_GL000760 [Enterococcus columbae DSM 7374 = ATCC 51263]